MSRFVLILLLLFTGCAKTASPSAGNEYMATVIKVVDGDTINVHVDAWKGTPLEKISLRVYGVDTPEKMIRFAKCEKEVRLGLIVSSQVRTWVSPGEKIRFVYRGKDKYFRVDADVFTPDGDDWGKKLISKGFAHPYFGGTKRNWCA